MATILTVDDSRVILKQYERFSSEFFPDHKFVCATSGPEAIELLKSIDDEISFAIIDYNMKEMDGIQVVEQIINRIPPERIVICSANLQKALQDKVEELKIGFVPKPVSSDKFKQIIEVIESKK